MKNILLIGQAASGKGTQAKLLSERLGLHTIAMGDILRDHKKKGTEIGKMATELDKEGKLMPDETIFDLMRIEIRKHKGEAKGFIFDGAVRTEAQALFLDKILKEMGLPSAQVFYFGISNDEVILRALKRFSTSNRIEDSSASVIEKRIDVFNEKTLPTLDYYKGGVHNYNELDAEQPIEDVYDNIISGLDESNTPLKGRIYKGVSILKNSGKKLLSYLWRNIYTVVFYLTILYKPISILFGYEICNEVTDYYPVLLIGSLISMLIHSFKISWVRASFMLLFIVGFPIMGYFIEPSWGGGFLKSLILTNLLMVNFTVDYKISKK